MTALADRFDGPARGKIDGFLIHDDGVDNLGADQRGIQPDEKWRGRLRLEHRHQDSWLEHANINDVMLATSLEPTGFLVLPPAVSPENSIRS